MNAQAVEADYRSWREALDGGKPGLQVEHPWLGYFRILDRRGDAQGRKREWVPCAIWIDPFRGGFSAEIDGDPVPVWDIWPYAAKHPITFEDYQKMHEERNK